MWHVALHHTVLYGDCANARVMTPRRRDARRNWTAENHLYNLVHRGYTSEPRGHPTCCFDFYKSWVNSPELAAAQVELLTRDADAPEEASGESIAPPPPSKLVAQTLAAGPAAHGSAATVNGVTSKLAGLKAWGAANGRGAAAPSAARGAV
jgi:hypothetical protein